MKKFVVGSIFLEIALTASAYAQTPVLECFTEENSVNLVSVIQNKDGTGALVIDYGGEGVDAFKERFAIVAGLRDLQKSDSATLIAVKNKEDYTAKAFAQIPQAAMMRVVPGKKEARLAMNGSVYVMRCNPRL